MSIIDIMPQDCPPELKVKIEKVMTCEKKTWEEAIVFLASKVVSPEGDRR